MEKKVRRAEGPYEFNSLGIWNAVEVCSLRLAALSSGNPQVLTSI